MACYKPTKLQACHPSQILQVTIKHGLHVSNASSVPAMLVAPNGIGADGMVINIATILAGTASNPFKTGYFEGDALAPLEAITACLGIFGAGVYPGFS